VVDRSQKGIQCGAHGAGESAVVGQPDLYICAPWAEVDFVNYRHSVSMKPGAKGFGQKARS
jgi:hypothetical protein